MTRPHDHDHHGQHRDVERFDNWAEHYDQSWLQRVLFDSVQNQTLAVAARITTPINSVLDVGCGTGRLLLRLRQAYPHASTMGIDPAPGMVRMARRQGLEAAVGSAEALPLPDGSFDLAVTTMSFHHWGDQASGLAEVRRVLSPGGHLLLVDAITTWWARPLFMAVGMHGRFHSRDELDRMFLEAGLRPSTRTGVPGTLGAVAVSAASRPVPDAAS
jgi:ubiquinone/menaquinone biosynthesis C-methylase UbiE